jgi:gamma-glutamylcyclotransferase (GGCT)/AIG2-like uncharacterized protein YtfP
MNENMQSIAKANKELRKQNASLVNENAALLYELRNGYGVLKMRIDAIAGDVMRLDALEQAVLDMGKAMPRIEREVTKFERLNNANEWVKS